MDSKPERIPVGHFFDERYCLAAAVAFHSMLRRASVSFGFDLYVVHSGISEGSQRKLIKLVGRFPNATLTFKRAPESFGRLFAKTQGQEHYSPEIYLKLIAPTLFPELKRILITDVDVVWCGDVAEVWREAGDLDDHYLAGVKLIRPRRGTSRRADLLDDFYRKYDAAFTESEREMVMTTGAGLWVFNLERMRNNNISQKFLHFAERNSHRLVQPEQDTVNCVCYPAIKRLPLRHMVCTFLYESYPSADLAYGDTFHDDADLLAAYLNPTQLHFAGREKPWNEPGCTKATAWFSELAQTEFLEDWLQRAQLRFWQGRQLFQVKVPFSGGRTLRIIGGRSN